MEIYDTKKLSAKFRKKYCTECGFSKHSILRCDALYIFECFIIDEQLSKLGSPCSHCAFINIENRSINCYIHNCEFYEKFRKIIDSISI